MKFKMISLPKGQLVNPMAIVAVRVMDSSPATASLPAHEPSVAIDYVVGNTSQCIWMDCDSVEERDALAVKIADGIAAVENKKEGDK